MQKSTVGWFQFNGALGYTAPLVLWFITQIYTFNEVYDILQAKYPEC